MEPINEFDQGFVRNFTRVFGLNPYTWLNPFTSNWDVEFAVQPTPQPEVTATEKYLLLGQTLSRMAASKAIAKKVESEQWKAFSG
jgi:hypothetical protein